MTIAPVTFPKTFYGEAPPAPANSPLSYAHFGELELANKRAKKIRRATRVAQTDAWICGIFAGLTLLSGIFSLTALLLGLALAFCAFNSFRGAKLLKNFNVSGPRLLALNQLLLAASLIIYGAWCLYSASRNPADLFGVSNADPALTQALAPYHQLAWVIALAVYGGLIVGTILAQGLAALYYATRRKLIAAYIEQTPAWILQLQKTQIGG